MSYRLDGGDLDGFHLRLRWAPRLRRHLVIPAPAAARGAGISEIRTNLSWSDSGCRHQSRFDNLFSARRGKTGPPSPRRRNSADSRESIGSPAHFESAEDRGLTP